MSFVSSCFHNLAQISCRRRNKYFIQSSKNLKKTQLEKILNLGFKSYESFISSEKVKSYNDIESKIKKLKSEPNQLKDIVRFEPTSGSTNKVKWIPYTKQFLDEIDFAVSPMLFDMYKRFNFIKKGKHFWSLSWLPEEMRHEQSNDDSELLNPIKALFFKNILCLEQKDVLKNTIEEAKAVSVSKILKGDLSLISVWSPTYFLELLNFTIDNKEIVKPYLEKKKAEALNSVSSLEDFSVFFDRKILFSSWGQGSSKKWLYKVKKAFPNFHFLEKGIWCTEGVITIPYKNKQPLAGCSHFYEFLNTQTKEIVPSWEVVKDKIYQPLITTGDYLRRYHIEDNLLCNDFHNDMPCFEFLGRDKHSDMVGEKLSQDMVKEISKKFEEHFSDQVISFVANDKLDQRPRYDIYIEGEPKEEAGRFLEEELQLNFHYKQAREKNQLDPCRLVYSPDSLKMYYEKRKKDGLIEGNIKIEPITFSRS